MSKEVIVILKLLSGEELIAKRNGDTYSTIRSFTFDKSGNAGLVPFFITMPDVSLPLNQGLILAEHPAPAEVEKSYRAAVSGIQLV